MYRIVNDANTQVEYIYMASKSQESSADWYEILYIMRTILENTFAKVNCGITR